MSRPCPGTAHVTVRPDARRYLNWECRVVEVQAATPLSYHTQTKEGDEAIRRLDADGEGHPAGRLYRVAIDADGEIEVFDIWESREALEKWGPEGFVPVLQDLGVELLPPTFRPVRNVIQS